MGQVVVRLAPDEVNDLGNCLVMCASVAWPRVRFTADATVIAGDNMEIILPFLTGGSGFSVPGADLHSALRKARGNVTIEWEGGELVISSELGTDTAPGTADDRPVPEIVRRVSARVSAKVFADSARRTGAERVVVAPGPRDVGVELWHPDRPLFASLTEAGSFAGVVTIRTETLLQVTDAHPDVTFDVNYVPDGLTLGANDRIWVIPSVERTAWRDPTNAVMREMWAHRHQCHLGHYGGCHWSDPQSAVLVLGIPRSGKTSGVLVPNIIAWPGPVLTTSSKTEIIDLTAQARSRTGRLWLFDPTGDAQVPKWLDLGFTNVAAPPVEQLRWSPVVGAESWREAQTVASEMARTASHSGRGGADQVHFVERAAQLIAVLLHAAALDKRGLRGVLRWLFDRELSEPQAILEDHLSRTNQGELAIGQLRGLTRTPVDELGSIWSTVDRVLSVYNTDEALVTTDNPNFDLSAFARSSDTVYIGGTTRDQTHAAAIIVGFLGALREAIYKAQLGRNDASVLWALDEMTNTAPMPDLNQVVSQAGGQHLIVMGVIQDLAQARTVWEREAEGMLGLFAGKVVLPGLSDTDTLRRLSELAGKTEVQLKTVSHSVMGDTESFHVELRERLPVDKIASGILEGKQAGGEIGAWAMAGHRIEPIIVQPFYQSFDGHGWALAAAGREFHARLGRIAQTVRIEITRALEATIEDVLRTGRFSRELWWGLWLGAQGSVPPAHYAQVAAVDPKTADKHLEQLAKKGALRWLPEHGLYWGGPMLVEALNRNWYPPAADEQTLYGLGDLAERAMAHLSGADEQVVAHPAVRHVVAGAVRSGLSFRGRCEVWTPPS